MTDENPIDDDCVELVKALNTLPGITTLESCCGHGQWPYQVHLRAESLDVLPQLCYWFNQRHSGCCGWRVIVSTDPACTCVLFTVEGPTGGRAFEEAGHIANLIHGRLKHEVERA